MAYKTRQVIENQTENPKADIDFKPLLEGVVWLIKTGFTLWVGFMLLQVLGVLLVYGVYIYLSKNN